MFFLFLAGKATCHPGKGISRQSSDRSIGPFASHPFGDSAGMGAATAARCTERSPHYPSFRRCLRRQEVEAAKCSPPFAEVNPMEYAATAAGHLVLLLFAERQERARGYCLVCHGHKNKYSTLWCEQATCLVRLCCH